MFFILAENEKYFKVLDSSDGVVEDISKAKFAFIKDKIKWENVSGTSGYKRALFTLLKSNINEFIISMPDCMSFSLNREIVYRWTEKRETYLFEKKAKNNWSYMINGRSKSYKSGLSDEEIKQVIGMCNPYSLYWENR